MRNKVKKSSGSFRLVLLSRMKGEPMRKLTKEQKRDIRVIAAKRDADIDFSYVINMHAEPDRLFGAHRILVMTMV
jgi:hypothetical protein